MYDIYKIAEKLNKFPNKIKLDDNMYYIKGKRRIYVFCDEHLISSIQYHEQGNEKYIDSLYVLHFMYYSTNKVMKLLNLHFTDKTKLIGEKTEIWKEDYDNEI